MERVDEREGGAVGRGGRSSVLAASLGNVDPALGERRKPHKRRFVLVQAR